MSWKRRLSIVLSAVWLLLVVALVSESYNGMQLTLVFGIFPLILIWGIWWVITGAKVKISIPPPGKMITTSPPGAFASTKGEQPSKKENKGWLSRALGTSACLFIFFLAKGLTHRQIDRGRVERAIDNGTVATELGIDSKSPLELMRSSNFTTNEFKSGWRLSFEAAYNRTGAKVRVLDVNTNDYSTSLAFITTFVGSMKFEDLEGLHQVNGENRRFFHSSGMLQLEGMCLTERSTCVDFHALLNDAQTKARTALYDLTVGGILPVRENADCEIVPLTDTFFGKDLKYDNSVCVYSDGTILSFTRFSEAQVRTMFKAFSTDAKGKELLRAALK